MGERGVVGVLGQVEQLERSPRIASRGGGVVLKSVESRVRPEDARLEDRVSRVGGGLRVRSRSCSASVNSYLSMSAFARSTAKRTPSTGSSRRSATSRDSRKIASRVEVVEHRVGAPECVGPGRVIGEVVWSDPPASRCRLTASRGLPSLNATWPSPARARAARRADALRELLLEHLPASSDSSKRSASSASIRPVEASSRSCRWPGSPR